MEEFIFTAWGLVSIALAISFFYCFFSMFFIVKSIYELVQLKKIELKSEFRDIDFFIVNLELIKAKEEIIRLFIAKCSDKISDNTSNWEQTDEYASKLMDKFQKRYSFVIPEINKEELSNLYQKQKEIYKK
jgi:hypothetical protein